MSGVMSDNGFPARVNRLIAFVLLTIVLAGKKQHGKYIKTMNQW